MNIIEHRQSHYLSAATIHARCERANLTRPQLRPLAGNPSTKHNDSHSPRAQVMLDGPQPPARRKPQCCYLKMKLLLCAAVAGHQIHDVASVLLLCQCCCTQSHAIDCSLCCCSYPPSAALSACKSRCCCCCCCSEAELLHGLLAKHLVAVHSRQHLPRTKCGGSSSNKHSQENRLYSKACSTASAAITRCQQTCCDN